MIEERPTALHFDGQSDYYKIDGSVDGPVGGPITVEFWCYVLPEEVQVYQRVLFAWEELKDDPDRALCHAPWGDGKLYWDYGDIDGRTDHFTRDGRIFTDYSSHIGKWTYVALVSEGVGGRFQGIYLDGELVASKEFSTGPSRALRKLSIGRSFGEYHHGAIDNFRIWNRVRSAEEIRARYRNTATKPSFLRTTEYLTTGDFLVSENRNYFAILQDDGNFYVCKGSGPLNQGRCLWGSQKFASRGTRFRGGRFFATMQTDGNFCVYEGTNPAHQGPYVWGTQRTAPGEIFFAVMQNDGNFCIYKGTGPEDQGRFVWGWMNV